MNLLLGRIPKDWHNLSRGYHRSIANAPVAAADCEDSNFHGGGHQVCCELKCPDAAATRQHSGNSLEIACLMTFLSVASTPRFQLLLSCDTSTCGCHVCRSPCTFQLRFLVHVKFSLPWKCPFPSALKCWPRQFFQNLEMRMSHKSQIWYFPSCVNCACTPLGGERDSEVLYWRSRGTSEGILSSGVGPHRLSFRQSNPNIVVISLVLCRERRKYGQDVGRQGSRGFGEQELPSYREHGAAERNSSCDSLQHLF